MTMIWRGELLRARRRRADEYLWRMPLWPEFKRGDESGLHADLQQPRRALGRREQRGRVPVQLRPGRPSWAHLDIAGTAYVGRSNKKAYGGTGYGVGLTLGWLMRQAQRS